MLKNRNCHDAVFMITYSYFESIAIIVIGTPLSGEPMRFQSIVNLFPLSGEPAFEINENNAMKLCEFRVILVLS